MSAWSAGCESGKPAIFLAWGSVWRSEPRKRVPGNPGEVGGEEEARRRRPLASRMKMLWLELSGREWAMTVLRGVSRPRIFGWTCSGMVLG